MLKRLFPLLALASAVIAVLPANASANKIIVGRVVEYNGSSLSVLDKEALTVTLDPNTMYSKLVTQKPWQQDTRLNASALGIGRFVAVHVRKDNPNVADWVQIATDMRSLAAVTAPATASSDLLTPAELKALIASAKTSADHLKLQKHYLALAAKYDAEASDHAAEAAAYRKNPTFMESKNPVAPGTAAHCDRLADRAREAAKEARDLASAHEHMADAAK